MTTETATSVEITPGDLLQADTKWITLRCNDEINLKDFLRSETHLKKWIYGKEVGARLHFHVVLGYDLKEEFGSQNKILRLRCSKVFGDGNAYFSLSGVRTTAARAIMYAVKDKNIKHFGFDEILLNRLVRASSKKLDKLLFQEALNLIVEDYMLSDEAQYPLWKFIDNFTNLKLDYNQKYDVRTIEMYSKTVYARKYRHHTVKVSKDIALNIENFFLYH